MLKVTDIDVLSNFSNSLLIRWEIEDTLEDLTNYTFSIYKSLSPDSNFILVASGITGFEYLYPIEHLDTSEITWYFKVEVVDTTTSETSMSDVFGSLYFIDPDPIACAIIYQHDYFLEHLLSRPPVKLLIKKRTGQRCTTCWDNELEQTTRSKCLTCYNTGYVGGYIPKDIYISFTEPGFVEKFDIGDINDTQQGVTQAWTSNYPLIKPNDYIVDEFNRRFRIIQSQPTTKDGRIYLRQMLQLQLVPPTNVIYKFNIT